MSAPSQQSRKERFMQAPALYYSDKWIDLRAALAAVSQDDLAYGYFRGYIPGGYQDSANRILCVCASVPGYLEPVFGKGPHPLENNSVAMEFARSLGKLGTANGDPLESIAVTAMCKVALMRGDVSPSLLLAQQQLAVQTLRYEIYGLAPKLLVFTCGGKYSAIIRESVNAARGSLADLQSEGQGNEALLFRARGDAGEPAVLVLQPPDTFPKSVQDTWLAKAAALIR